MKKSLLIFLKILRKKFALNPITFALLVKKFVKWESHDGVFGGTKSGVGYLRVWEGHGQWFVLGEILHCGSKKKSLSNATNFFLGFVFANFALFPLEIVKSCQV